MTPANYWRSPIRSPGFTRMRHPAASRRTAGGAPYVSPRLAEHDSADAAGHRQAGLVADLLEVVRPTDVQLRQVISRERPRLVIAHADLRRGSFVDVAAEHPEVAFCRVIHSTQNHTFFWPEHFAVQRAAIEASNSLPHCWFATPDFWTPWQALGYPRCFHWSNPVYLPDERPGDTARGAGGRSPVILIASRLDWVKALPAQIAAAALVQRSHGPASGSPRSRNLPGDSRG